MDIVDIMLETVHWGRVVNNLNPLRLITLAAFTLVTLLPPSTPATTQVTTDQILYDGEPGSVPLADLSCVEYAADTTEAAHGGSHSLKLLADPWHSPALKLYCGGSPRRNLSGYDVIEFYMRAADAANPPPNPTFRVTTWHASSNTASILDYIEGGVLDGTWRRVQIPISALQTAEWDLGDVEFLKWGPDSQYRTSLVDDIAARDVSAPELQQVVVESHRYLRLRFAERFDPVARDPAHYTLLSDSDLAYASPQRPTDVGFEWRVVDFGGSTPMGSSEAPLLRFDVTLRLPTPLQPNTTYTLTVEGITDLSGNPMPATEVPLAFDPDALNPNIKVNQVGYLPDGPKWGYVGGYLGDLGGGLWAVGEEGTILHWTPSTGWTTTQYPIPNTQSLRAVYPLTEYDIWAVGDAGTVIHWDGANWQTVTVPTTADLYDVHFTPQAEGWIAGSDGTVLHWVPGTAAWELVATPTTAALRGIFAMDASTAWAVGDSGAFLSWDGNTWAAIDSPTTATLHDVGGFPGAGAWAVGEGGTILELQYGNWQEVASPTTVTLRHVVGDPNGVAIAVGDGGVILRRDGFGDEAFDVETTSGTADLHAVAFLDARQGFAFGPVGLAYRYDYNSGTWVTEDLPAAVTLYGAAALPYGVLRINDHLSVRNQVFFSKNIERRLSEPPSLTNPLPVIDEKPGFLFSTNVDIVDAATGATVLTIPLVLRAANWHLSGEDVFAFDFSGLTMPGTYRVRVPGFGVSDAFTIGAGVFREAARIAARGLYHQRCGTALTMTDHPHGACHTDDAVYHDSVAAWPLYNGEPVGGYKNVVGGWHDAGDYGKYVPTGASALWFLLTSFELGHDLCFDMPSATQHKFGADQDTRFGDDWGIPESGNGVPDLLDEARWELDWLARLQETDGGVYHKVTTACWVSGMPDASTDTRYILPKTTHDTALAAAVLALGSRLWQPYDPALAATYLTRAELAWDFLQAHPTAEPTDGFVNPDGVCTGDYNDPDGDADDRAWAAAELYRTTGAAKYHAAFGTYWRQNSPLWGWNDWQHHQQKASWAYVNIVWPDVNPVWQQQIRDAFVSDAEMHLSRTQTNVYHNGARLDVPVWIGWGAFTQSTRYAFRLLQAYALSGDNRYWDAALTNLNTQLGANPLGLSFITGIGARYPHDPLQMPTMYDGIAEPVPGIPVFGVMAVLSNANPYYAAVQDDDNSYPYAANERDPYPILRRYVDTNEVVPHSEFTIQEMGWTVGVLGLFACTLSGDINDDGQVDVADVMAVAADWRNPDFAPAHDLDDDGDVDIMDIMLVAVHWGDTCLGWVKLSSGDGTR
jgi:hypothetical protein